MQEKKNKFDGKNGKVLTTDNCLKKKKWLKTNISYLRM